MAMHCFIFAFLESAGNVSAQGTAHKAHGYQIHQPQGEEKCDGNGITTLFLISVAASNYGANSIVKKRTINGQGGHVFE